MKDILIEGKKCIKISKYQTGAAKKLKDEFSRVQTLMSQLSQQQSFLTNFSTYR